MRTEALATSHLELWLLTPRFKLGLKEIKGKSRNKVEKSQWVIPVGSFPY